MRATSLIVKASSLLSERGSMAISEPAAIWLLKEGCHNISDLMLLSSHFWVWPSLTCRPVGGPSDQPQIGKSGAVVVGRGWRETAEHDPLDAARRRR